MQNSTDSVQREKIISALSLTFTLIHFKVSSELPIVPPLVFRNGIDIIFLHVCLKLNK